MQTTAIGNSSRYYKLWTGLRLVFRSDLKHFQFSTEQLKYSLETRPCFPPAAIRESSQMCVLSLSLSLPAVRTQSTITQWEFLAQNHPYVRTPPPSDCGDVDDIYGKIFAYNYHFLSATTIIEGCLLLKMC